MIDWSKIVDWSKLPLRVIVAIAMGTSFLLFAPAHWLERVHLKEAAAALGVWLGLVWLLSVLVVVTSALTKVFRSAIEAVRGSRFRRSAKAKLRELNQEERAFLRWYFEHDTRTQPADLGDGVVSELAAYQILRRASGVNVRGRLFAFNILPWAWDYLAKRRHLLLGDGKEDEDDLH